MCVEFTLIKYEWWTLGRVLTNKDTKHFYTTQINCVKLLLNYLSVGTKKGVQYAPLST